MLATTTLSARYRVNYAQGSAVVPKHDAAYWDEVTRGFDFSRRRPRAPRPLKQSAVGGHDGRQAVSGPFAMAGIRHAETLTSKSSDDITWRGDPVPPGLLLAHVNDAVMNGCRVQVY